MTDDPPIRICCATTDETPVVRDGRLHLQAEKRWVVTGPESALAPIQAALPPATVERIGSALVLRFGNAVGAFDLPGLGVVEVCSGKWGEAAFQRMLADISKTVASLPFWAGTGAQVAHDRSIAREEVSRLHRLAYLRYICSDHAPFDDQVLPALRRIVADPHRRLLTRTRAIPPALVRRVDARMLEDIAAGCGHRDAHGIRVGDPPLIAGAELPESVREQVNEATVDVPENRFVRLFLDMCLGVLEECERWAASQRDGTALAATVTTDVARIRSVMGAVRRHRMWEDIGPLHGVPVQSTVLQRRYGYRQVLRHYVLLRLAPRIPLSADTLQRLLEIKNIAKLYELWCFFAVVEAASASAGQPSTAEVIEATTTAQGTTLGQGLAVGWPDGTRVSYNETFSRSRADPWFSYSGLPRPDITVEAVGGGEQRLHVLDAKFRLGDAARLPTTALACDDDAEEETGYRCLRDDLDKMHAYRDALPAVRSAWVLYPGDQFQFFPVARSVPPVSSAASLPERLDGVGAVPVQPDQYAVLYQTIRRMLGA